MLLAISKRRFTEGESEQTKWVNDVRDTLELINNPTLPTDKNVIGYKPDKTGKKGKKKEKQYGVEDDDMYNEPDSAIQSLKGKKTRPINADFSDDDIDVEDYEQSTVLRAAEPYSKQNMRK